MRLLHFVAVRTFAESGLGKMVVSPTGAGAAFGMASFWIWHLTTPYSFEGTAARNALRAEPEIQLN
jgi:hypothetical protein